MTVDQAIGGVVWIQGMVILTAVLLAVFELGFWSTGRRRAFVARQRLALSTCAALLALLALGPFLGAMPFAASVNATDVFVGQYLKGNVAAMSATDVSALVTFKTRLVDGLARGGSWIAIAALAVFFAALVSRAIYLGLNVWRIRQIVRGARPLRQQGRVSILVAPGLTVPFSTRGFRRYAVILPERVACDRAERELALSHELQHIRQGDVDAEMLMALLSPLFLLNPGYWFIAGRIRRLGEFACDGAVLARHRIDARSYSMRLLNIARRAANTGPRAFGVPLIGRPLPLIGRRGSVLRDRVLAIASAQERPVAPHRGLGLAAGLALVLAVLFLGTTLSKPADWSHERIMLSTVTNLERINQINTLAQRSW